MKKCNKRVRFRRIPIAPCVGAFLYLLLIAACVIFTQALRSSVSAMVLYFVLLLPAADLSCLALSWFFVTAEVEENDRVITRGDRLTVPVRVSNKGLLPISCVEATLSVPGNHSLRSRLIAKRISLPSFTSATTGVSVGFSCRGFFLVGVEEVFLFDLLRLVRVRKRIRRYVGVRVLPKRLPSVGGLPPFVGGEESRRETLERNAAEYGDLRQYQPGDGIKSIHWKLSTKLDELQVRKHNTEAEKEILIFTDFVLPASSPLSAPVASAVDNRLAEEALTAACDAARQGAVGRLMWYGADGLPVIRAFFDERSAEALAFPLSEAEGGRGDLPREAVEKEGISVLYVVSYASAETEERIRRAATVCAGAPFSVLLLSLGEILPPEELEAYRRELDRIRLRLAESGITVTKAERKEVEEE